MTIGKKANDLLRKVLPSSPTRVIYLTIFLDKVLAIAE
jgi:hypothetical protein